MCTGHCSVVFSWLCCKAGVFPVPAFDRTAWLLTHCRSALCLGGSWNLHARAVREAPGHVTVLGIRTAAGCFLHSARTWGSHSYRAGVAGVLASPLPGTVLDSLCVGQATPFSQRACSTDEGKRR